MADDSLDLPTRCADGLEQSIKPDITDDRNLKNIIDNQITGEDNNQKENRKNQHR